MVWFQVELKEQELSHEDVVKNLKKVSQAMITNNWRKTL